jgi:hypothetical protein
MPAALEKINLHYYATMRISISEKFRSDIARSALYYVEHYLNGLITQWNRIADEMEASTQLMRLNLQHDRAAAAVFTQMSDREDFDTHFFLICWDKVHKFLELFERAQADAPVSAICREISPVLEKGAEARDYLEHLDQRLEAGGGKTRARAGGGGGNLVISYEERLKGGVVQSRSEAFGREEIRHVAQAYNRILEQMGAKLQPSLLGTEVGQPGDQPQGGFP